MGTGLKENRNSWLARVIVIVLALTFIVGLGYTGGFSGSGVSSGVALEVDGDAVSISYYQLVRKQIYNSQTAGMDKVPVEIQDAIDRITVNFLIQRKLLARKARALGLRVSDEEIRQTINSDPAFVREGGFVGADYYKFYITENLRLTVSQFEDSIRDENLTLKMASLSRISEARTLEEMENLFMVTGEKIKVEYISFDTNAEAQSALDELTSSGDISEAAKKFGKKTTRTGFFTRFETPSPLGHEMFALTLSNPVAPQVFSSGGVHTVAVLKDRKSEDPALVRDKTRVAAGGAPGEGVAVLNNWIQMLFAAADVKTSKEILR
ncbi:SurA N-terminal domain-containing protein [Candidatus Mycalebacterium sp.]